MKKQEENFCAGYISLLKEKGILTEDISDGRLIIDTIKTSDPIELNYKKPRLIYDSYEKKKVYAKPQISVISYGDLQKLGFVVVKRSPRKKWFYRQTVVYKIVKDSSYFSYGKLPTTPPHHNIEFDVTNKVVRLAGKNAGPRGVGEWEQVK